MLAAIELMIVLRDAKVIAKRCFFGSMQALSDIDLIDIRWKSLNAIKQRHQLVLPSNFVQHYGDHVTFLRVGSPGSA